MRRRLGLLVLLAMAMLGAAVPAQGEPRVSGSPGPDCHSSCANRCYSVPCSGLNLAQCDRVRASCRRSCEARCR